MPPGNTTSDAPVEDASLLPRSITPMSYLAAPVPDLAATLYTHSTDAAADEANTTFLRQSLDLLSTSQQPSRTSNIDQSRDPRLGLSRRERNTRSNRSTSPVQRDHLQRYLTHLYRMHHPPASGATAYSNRTPSPHRQSIYDWAPAPDSARPRESIWGARPIASEDMESRRRHQRSSLDEQPLPSATERMLRYFMERERSGLSEEEERARGAGWYRPSPARAGNTDDWHGDTFWSTTPANEEPLHRLRQERVDAFRREYLSGSIPRRTTTASPLPNAATADDPPLTEIAMKYLDELRHCEGMHDAIQTAIELDLISKPLFSDGHIGFIFNLDELSPPSTTSWLQPGTVFEGHQYASTAILPRADHVDSYSRNHVQSRQRINDHPPGSTPFTGYREMNLLRSHTSAASLRGLTSGSDHWPVRMIIHTINTDDMTLQGTMEAYDVPQHTFSRDLRPVEAMPKAGRKGAPITTYVEGHIIDCFHHSFLTPKPHSIKHKSDVFQTLRDGASIFPASKPSRDAENWRKLPPFNELSDKAVTETLLSKERMNAVNEQFVFMRWKERCFVHGKNDACTEHEKHSDNDKGHGLTISGFYYISMRRSDASIEGLYYDPNSTPYQHLRLKGMRAVWPAWSPR